MRTIIAIVALVGCGRIDFGLRADGGDSGLAGDAAGDAAVDSDAMAVQLTWGDYAATLPIAPCTGAELVVTDSTDSLDGGTTITDPSQAGATLSYVEAVWIASNRGGSNAIVFDPAVFPADAPATIVMDASTQLPSSAVPNLCTDGRSRGVIVDWMACMNVGCPLWVGIGSRLIGVTYVHPRAEMEVLGQIAGCRMGTDGTTGFGFGSFWTMNLDGGAEVGPGNSLGGTFYAMRAFANTVPGAASVHDNDIGRDPLTGSLIGVGGGALEYAIQLYDIFAGTYSFVMSGNVIVVSTSVATILSTPEYIPVFTGNFVGVDRTRHPLGPGLAGFEGLSSASSTPVTIGPGNVIENVANAVSIGNSIVLVTQNVITGNGTGITCSTCPPAPTVTVATATQITGTCTTDNDVLEVFADPGDEGATYLGSTDCLGLVFTLTGTFPVGLNATATETHAGQTTPFSAPVAIQ